MLRRIVVIGPESTGKSTLCKQLANYFDTLWCPEFARDYLNKQGKNYTYPQLLTIAKGQINLEDFYILKAQQSQKSLLFIDTDMYVMQVWCKFVFNKVHKFILDQIKNRKYDLYLLCYHDLPWVKDELREYPDIEIRTKLYRKYESILQNQPTPFVVIKGNFEQRLQTAIHAINLLS